MMNECTHDSLAHKEIMRHMFYVSGHVKYKHLLASINSLRNHSADQQSAELMPADHLAYEGCVWEQSRSTQMIDFNIKIYTLYHHTYILSHSVENKLYAFDRMSLYALTSQLAITIANDSGVVYKA